MVKRIEKGTKMGRMRKGQTHSFRFDGTPYQGPQGSAVISGIDQWRRKTMTNIHTGWAAQARIKRNKENFQD